MTVGISGCVCGWSTASSSNNPDWFTSQVNAPDIDMNVVCLCSCGGRWKWDEVSVRSGNYLYATVLSLENSWNVTGLRDVAYFDILICRKAYWSLDNNWLVSRNVLMRKRANYGLL